MRDHPIDEGRRWLAQASEDLKWARHLANEGGWYIACFLAQQVAEKAIKAYLYAQGEEIVIGHSVVRLCASASGYNPVFAEKTGQWGILDSYYIPTRYPNGLPDGIPADVYSKEIAQGAVTLANDVVEFITRLINQI